jgi:hypothetical protein
MLKNRLIIEKNMKLNEEQLEFILRTIQQSKKEHPKATIFFDTRFNGVQIIYPLPPDFLNIKKINIEEYE